MKHVPRVIKLYGTDLEISGVDTGGFFSLSQPTHDGIITLHIDDISTVVTALENVIAIKIARDCAA
jgi:hypothetical protein